MMKWLRRYSKQIMVVVVLFSMLAFVGGQALTSILRPEPAAQLYAYIWGKAVAYRDLQPAQRDTEILQRLFVPWQYDRDRKMAVRHWYILWKEAERAGIEVSDQEVEESLQKRLATVQSAGYGSAEAYLERLRDRDRITEMDVRAALRRHLAIWKNFARVGDAAVPSEPEVRHYVRDTEVKVNVKFVAVDAQKFVDEKEPLSEADLQAQFEKYKDVDAAESPMGMGYRFPRRVKLQYILASNTQIESQLEVSLDEAIAYWKKNKANYVKTEYVDESVPAAESQPASPPNRVPRVVEKSFSEARPDVERDIRKRKAAQVAEQAMRKAASELAKSWDTEKTDPTTQYKAIPPGMDDPEVMRSVCDRIQKEFNVPLTYAETPLSSKDDLGAIPALKSASAEGEGGEKVGGKVSLIDYAFHNPVFLPKATAEEGGGLHLQLFQSSDAPLKADVTEFPAGQKVQTAYWVLFRVVEAQEAAAPSDLAEVRPQVERDLRLSHAFQRAEPTAKEVFAVASRLGVQESLEFFSDLRTDQRLSSIANPRPFARRVNLQKLGTAEGYTQWMNALQTGKPTLVVPNVEGVGTAEEFVDACFQMAELGWEPPAVAMPDTPHTQGATTRPSTGPQLVQLLPLSRLHKWFVIQLINKLDVDQEKYEGDLRASSYKLLQDEQTNRLYHNWFLPSMIDLRCGFKEVGKERTDFGGEGVSPPGDSGGDWPI